MISDLVYYHDTEVFFDKYYEEILEIRAEYEDIMGKPMVSDYQLKNSLAWICVEFIAFKLYTFNE